jgi:hypothetical protein
MSFAAWIAENPLAANPALDLDADGLNNFLEYALASNPEVHVATHVPSGGLEQLSVAGEPPAPYLVIKFRKRSQVCEVTYQPQFSCDLQNWTQPGVLHASVGNGDGTVTETWRSASPIGSLTRMFARLKVTQ